jgi:hypothetical protein
MRREKKRFEKNVDEKRKEQKGSELTIDTTSGLWVVIAVVPTPLRI